jgi:phosphoglycolate phosphatase
VVQAVQTLIATSGTTAVVLSLNLRHTVETGLRKLGLQSISAGVGADDVRRWKPDPQGVNELLARASVHPSEAVFVGDSQRDAGAAAAAGISFLRV